MRQLTGNWRIDERRDGAARLILKSVTGEEIYFDLVPADVTALRSRLGEIAPPVVEPQSSENPEPDQAEVGAYAPTV